MMAKRSEMIRHWDDLPSLDIDVISAIIGRCSLQRCMVQNDGGDGFDSHVLVLERDLGNVIVATVAGKSVLEELGKMAPL